MKTIRHLFVAMVLALGSLNTATAQELPDLSALFGGGQPSNPFAPNQANAFSSMMAPMNMMGGTNPMVMMMSPANWLNPNAYAQFANPMSYMSMMNPMSYGAFFNPMTYLPMMNPNAYMQMFNPLLGMAGVSQVPNISAIDPNTYVNFLTQLLGSIHGKPETSDNFLEKLKNLGQ